MSNAFKCFFILIGMVMVSNDACGAFHAKLTLKLIDDEARALTNMHVVAGFDTSADTSGSTDSNGLFTCSGESICGDAAYFVQTDGYYRSQGQYKYTGGITNGCFQPWNPVVNVLVRKIINPIPMIGKRVMIEVPELERAVGYDLVKGDWVMPYGKGEEPDINVTLRKRFVNIRDFDSSMTISFPNVVDGMQETPRLPFRDSYFKLVRVAPVSGYNVTNVVVSESSTNYFEPDDKMSYFLRIRARTNEEGRIVSAMYGKIPKYIAFDVRRHKAGIIGFPYLINPTPNDRNMEFDPSRNLFKNLKSTERVVEP